MAAQARHTAAPLIALLIATLLSSGCQTSERYQGETGIVAKWHGRTLSTEVPDAVGVPGAHYAAVEALQSRGYAVVADEATADRGYLAARGPDGTVMGGYRRVVVRTALTPAAVGVKITLEPAGDEVAARAILDDLLRRLGL